jgi:hypothetical protein
MVGAGRRMTTRAERRPRRTGFTRCWRTWLMVWGAGGLGTFVCFNVAPVGWTSEELDLLNGFFKIENVWW